MQKVLPVSTAEEAGGETVALAATTPSEPDAAQPAVPRWTSRAGSGALPPLVSSPPKALSTDTPTSAVRIEPSSETHLSPGQSREEHSRKNGTKGAELDSAAEREQQIRDQIKETDQQMADTQVDNRLEQLMCQKKKLKVELAGLKKSPSTLTASPSPDACGATPSPEARPRVMFATSPGDEAALPLGESKDAFANEVADAISRHQQQQKRVQSGGLSSADAAGDTKFSFESGFVKNKAMDEGSVHRRPSMLGEKLKKMAYAMSENEEMNIVGQHENLEEAQVELFKDCEAKILNEAEFPMLVVEFEAFEEYGKVPRSSAKLQIPRKDDHVVIFISHRWWNPTDCRPDDVGGPYKHRAIIRGIRALRKLHNLDLKKIAIWMDFASIEQDDAIQQRAGINSLLTYAMRSEFLLIPVFPRVDDSATLCSASHPFDLLNYGDRAWCRLEIFVFSCVAELKRIEVNCYACGVRFPTSMTDAKVDEKMRLEGLVPSKFGGCLPRSSTPFIRRLFREGSAWFSPEYRASAGSLTIESDRYRCPN